MKVLRTVIGWQNPKILGAADSILSNHIVPGSVNTCVLLDEFIRSMQRPMRSRECKPAKEWFAILATFIDVLNHLVRVSLGRIKIFR